MEIIITSSAGNQETLNMVDDFITGKITKEELVDLIDKSNYQAYSMGYEQCQEDSLSDEI